MTHAVSKYAHLQKAIAAKECPLCALPASFETRGPRVFMVCVFCKLTHIDAVYWQDSPRESSASIRERHAKLRSWGF